MAVTHHRTKGVACFQPSSSSSSRWEQSRRQQFAILLGELNKAFVVPSQPAPVSPMHVPKGQSGKEQSTSKGDQKWVEEQRESADRVYGRPAPGERNEGFQASSSVFDPLLFPKNGAM